jgi:predicted MFS family arabinose efflux permease
MNPLPAIVILMVLNHIAFGGGRVTVTLFALDQRASALTVGLLLALYAALPAIVSVRAGRWIDREGMQRPMLLGSLGVGLSTLIPALIPGLVPLYVSSVLGGVAFMLVNVAAYHAVGELSTPEDRPVNFSYIALGFSISSFIAPILAGVAIDNFGHRIAFALLALFTLLPIAGLAMRLIDFPKPTPHDQTDHAGSVFELLKDPVMRRLFITMAMLTVAWDVYGFAIPVRGSELQLSASKIGVVMGAFAAATFTIRLAIPFMVTRMRPWTLLSAALLTAGVSFIALNFAQSTGTMMVCVFFLGLGLGAPQPMMLTLLHESAPKGRAAEAVGLRTTLINGSQTLMPILFGAVGTVLGVLPLFWAIGLTLLGGGFFARNMAQSHRSALD